MRKYLTVAIVLCVIGLAWTFRSLIFPRANMGGPRNTILNNLRQLDGAKEQWILERKPSTNTWPSQTDLLPYLSQRLAKTLDEALPPLKGEVYIVNRTDRPVAAYLTKDAFGFKEGQLLTIEDIEGHR